MKYLKDANKIQNSPWVFSDVMQKLSVEFGINVANATGIGAARMTHGHEMKLRNPLLLLLLLSL